MSVFHVLNLDAFGIKEGKVFIMQNILIKEQLMFLQLTRLT